MTSSFLEMALHAANKFSLLTPRKDYSSGSPYITLSACCTSPIVLCLQVLKKLCFLEVCDFSDKTTMRNSDFLEIQTAHGRQKWWSLIAENFHNVTSPDTCMFAAQMMKYIMIIPFNMIQYNHNT